MTPPEDEKEPVVVANGPPDVGEGFSGWRDDDGIAVDPAVERTSLSAALGKHPSWENTHAPRPLF